MAKKCKKMQISPKNANKTICNFWTSMLYMHACDRVCMRGFHAFFFFFL